MAAGLAWRLCDHLDRGFEDDLLRSEVMLEELDPLAGGGLLLARRLVCAGGEQDDGPRPVLDWHLGGLMP